jgi:hypothetical protein
VRDERRSQHLRRVWANLSLSIILCILFFVSWGLGHLAMAEFVQDQRLHNQPAEAGEFLVDFGASTLENWQSEFLQLFSFVVVAAAFIHRGSCESRDSDDRMEQMLKEITAKIWSMTETVDGSWVPASAWSACRARGSAHFGGGNRRLERPMNVRAGIRGAARGAGPSASSRSCSRRSS